MEDWANDKQMFMVYMQLDLFPLVPPFLFSIGKLTASISFQKVTAYYSILVSPKS